MACALLLCIAGLRINELPRLLNYLGLFIGTVGIFTIYPAEILTEIFGLGQILWFSWLGVVMLMSYQSTQTSANSYSTRNIVTNSYLPIKSGVVFCVGSA
ncbi:hypothetical protein [Litorilituus lipolyticus]|uniref:hypothetical protein n=1 Tax=Litorilituus lipolyticus TaxID=2491017 RepID=UPI001FE8DE24|nr:hypothetical protein [Litorilituus lipolyticus]